MKTKLWACSDLAIFPSDCVTFHNSDKTLDDLYEARFQTFLICMICVQKSIFSCQIFWYLCWLEENIIHSCWNQYKRVWPASVIHFISQSHIVKSPKPGHTDYSICGVLTIRFDPRATKSNKKPRQKSIFQWAGLVSISKSPFYGLVLWQIHFSLLCLSFAGHLLGWIKTMWLPSMDLICSGTFSSPAKCLQRKTVSSLVRFSFSNADARLRKSPKGGGEDFLIL